MAAMDRSFVYLCLSLLCASVFAIDIPTPAMKWVERRGSPVTVQCGLQESGHFWWLGDDINDPSTFGRFGAGSQQCGDGQVCTVPYDSFNKRPNTYICCTNNGPHRFEDATSVECQEIAVCPSTQMSVPLVVETDRIETAYIKILTKPPPIVPPENLLAISIEGGVNINLTSSVMTPRLLTTVKALETVYKFQFQVPHELLVSSTTTLRFVPLISGSIPYDDSICDDQLLQPESVSGVSLQSPTDPLTTAPITDEATTQSDSTTGDLQVACVHFGIPVGSSILAFVGGLVVGLVTCWAYWCSRNKRGMASMSKHQEGFGLPSDSIKRGLPDPPITSQPPSFIQLNFPPNTLPHQLTTQQSNGGLTATPTPDETAGLLAGQTPNNYPIMDKHPLNHDPVPYATTNQMRSLSIDYSPPETKHLTIASRADGYPYPVGDPPPDMADEHGGRYMFMAPLPSDGLIGVCSPDPTATSSPYTREGNHMKLDVYKEEDVVV